MFPDAIDSRPSRWEEGSDHVIQKRLNSTRQSTELNPGFGYVIFLMKERFHTFSNLYPQYRSGWNSLSGVRKMLNPIVHN